MLCDSCGKREAIIAYTKMQGNDIEEVHLCAECAEEKMKKDLVFNNAVSEKMESFLKDLFKLTGKFNNSTPNKSCKHCGTTFAELENNKLGCEMCYEEFKEEIEEMLSSFTSSSRHKGKIPVGAGSEIISKREENELLDKLSVAIELEEYEEAAVLRDKLKELRGK
ncbi:UvrB/UvrC motif-containing protein [Anaerosphaera multitolerans]|uniref:Excinuclease ABC subunit B n=1 Tax=Anaerosphaera multitolerans TaxID=2487351 RepID=A0A437S5K7_9FIRM|nr:UvrB/UvrC motif-containing protein [Anaerosphaera multitolerans]RVU54284.1 excinuclease ABC subunit B [Anaerosphaera multitolerans]